MRRYFARWHARTLRWHHLTRELLLVMALLLFVVVPPVSAALRLQERSLYMNSTDAGVTTFHRLTFRYMSPDPIGSVELLYCIDPIPYHPCVVPPGLSTASVVLGEQIGETGFSLAERSGNRLLLSRSPAGPVNHKSSYVFDGVVNPTDTNQAFAIRIKTFASTDGTGPQIDFGSVRGQVTPGVVIQTQVPPMLIFCLAEEVEYNCTGTNEVYYKDMGQLSANNTLTAQSQMAVGTNASAGFAIIASGAPLSAGVNVIKSLDQPTASRAGTNQFGINLVANTQPSVGHDPEGDWANAAATPDYAQPDKYKFVSGDLVASSPNVSLMKKFTVSYIVNASPGLKAGVYSTTVNFIASGRF